MGALPPELGQGGVRPGTRPDFMRVWWLPQHSGAHTGARGVRARS